MGKFKTWELVDMVNKVFGDFECDINPRDFEYDVSPFDFASMEEFEKYQNKVLEKERNKPEEIRKEIIDILYMCGNIDNEFFEEDLRWVLGEFPHNDETYEDYIKHGKNCEEFAHRIKLWIKDGCIGDIYSYEEFFDMVKCGSIIDYDGRGKFIDDEGNNLGEIMCNCVWLKKNKSDRCKYVMWYNK